MADRSVAFDLSEGGKSQLEFLVGRDEIELAPARDWHFGTSLNKKQRCESNQPDFGLQFACFHNSSFLGTITQIQRQFNSKLRCSASRFRSPSLVKLYA